MGCDIHAHIDYDDFRTKEGDWFVSCFAQNVRLGRDYTLFALMAGVRYDPRTDSAYSPLFEPRGLPGRVSWSVLSAYRLSITDNENLIDEEGYCSKVDAEGWVGRGISKWMDDDHTVVSHPDWHSASWLSVADMEQIVAAYDKIEFAEQSWIQFNPPEEQPIPDNATATKLPLRYREGFEWYVEVGEKTAAKAPAALLATIEAMKALNDGGEDRARLVFWFDN